MYDQNDRIISTSQQVEDIKNENNIRPRWLKDYIGQDKVKEKLEIFIESALSREEPLDHVLLQGLLVLEKLPYQILSPMNLE